MELLEVIINTIYNHVTNCRNKDLILRSIYPYFGISIFGCILANSFLSFYSPFNLPSFNIKLTLIFYVNVEVIGRKN